MLINLEGRAYKNAAVNSNVSYFVTCTFPVNMFQPLPVSVLEHGKPAL